MPPLVTEAVRAARGGPLAAAALGVLFAAPAAAGGGVGPWRFDFGSGAAAAGRVSVGPATVFSAEAGYGLEPGAEVRVVEGEAAGAPRRQCLAATRPFSFSLAVPEGNYDVTVLLGDPRAAAATTVKAESRRLMVENAGTAAGQLVERTFTVNVRTPAITWTAESPGGGGAVSLNEREKGVPHWDDRLTLEFTGARPSVCAVEVARNEAAPTVFLAGDSTVTDQPREPFASWGQMLTRFLRPGVAVANHAESGASLKSFLAGGRLAKLTSQMRKGDYLLVQFGHNDQKPASPSTYVEARTAYAAYLRVFVAEARQRGATPVLVTPVQRRQWDEAGKVRNSHGDYPQVVREVAEQEKVALIDLEAMSRAFYEALGQERAPLAFADEGRDATHHNDYGAYELAKCVAQGMRARGLELAAFLADDFRGADPARPGPPPGSGPQPGRPLPEPARPGLPSLLLVGDSTVRNGNGDGGNGQWGWGDLLAPYFDTARLNVVNRALGGLSSRTYRTFGYWDRTLALVKPGDVVLIQLGHNDGGPVNDTSRARGTLRGVGEETEEIDNLITRQHEVVHTYGWYLRGFVAEVKARGAVPIVCSPVPRQRWAEGHVVRDRDAYAGWAAEVARAAGVGFIDLNEAVARRYEELGAAAVEPLFSGDNTHTSRAGAEINAAAVVAGLKALPGAPLSAFFSEKAAGVPPARP
jgi:lysophospholipase L1-like esterase